MSKDESSEGGEPEVQEDAKAQAYEQAEDEEEESEEEEDEEEEDEDAYSTKLRSGRTRTSIDYTDTTQSVTSTRQDRKPPARGKRPLPSKKRRTATNSRGRKKQKTGYGNDWPEDKDSGSEESYHHPEDAEAEAAPAIVQKFLYNPGIPWPDLSPYMQHMIEIRIAREFLTFDNKEVSSRRLWGTEVYTSDSDLVAVLHHSGLIDLTQPIPDRYEGISVYARISKGRSNYVSTVKYNLKSKKCVNYEGHSIKPDRVVYLENLGSLDELREMASRMPTDYQRARVKPNINMRKRTLIPMAFLISSLSAELWPIYSLEYIGDKGTEERNFLSSRLKSEVLYLETENERYELCRVADDVGDKDIFEQGEKVRWSTVKTPLLTKDLKFMSENKLPLEATWAKPIHKSTSQSAVDWSEIEWGSQHLHVKGVAYGPLKCLKFFPLRS